MMRSTKINQRGQETPSNFWEYTNEFGGACVDPQLPAGTQPSAWLACHRPLSVLAAYIIVPGDASSSGAHAWFSVTLRLDQSVACPTGIYIFNFCPLVLTARAVRYDAAARVLNFIAALCLWMLC